MVGRLPVVVALLFGGALFLFWWATIRMPATSFRGPVTDFSAEELALSKGLESDVRVLASDIGERNLRHPAALDAAASWIEHRLRDMSLRPRLASYSVDGHAVHNIEAVFVGTSPNPSVVVVGAHYDSALGTAGANDNASGVAVLLEVARRFTSYRAKHELRLVWFTNEEPPHFQSRNMGSLRYARALAAEHRKVVAMLSLETLGFYSDRPDSQQYPAAVFGLFPDTGNFLAFVGNNDSVDLVRDSIASFRATTRFPSEGLSLSASVPGIGWSDHWSFWQTGVPAIMLTDTALFRYPHYHRSTDTPDRLDYPRLARVTLGVEHVLRSLLGVTVLD
jgi:Zn-dependent M28 family amino/carboxypeptidase